MAAKALEQEMNAYFTQLSIAEKKSVIQMIKTFLKRENKVPERISLDQYNIEIDEAMTEVAQGKSYSHEEVIKMSENW